MPDFGSRLCLWSRRIPRRLNATCPKGTSYDLSNVTLHPPRSAGPKRSCGRLKLDPLTLCLLEDHCVLAIVVFALRRISG